MCELYNLFLELCNLLETKMCIFDRINFKESILKHASSTNSSNEKFRIGISRYFHLRVTSFLKLKNIYG